ncbi:MAG: hypothetical protein JNK79_20685 [Chitinophagaceae bacterium]|nr:hypothetical protein [Chitinophagaceae bacterium]
MELDKLLKNLTLRAKGNRWFRYFTVFCRVMLAFGFIPSGIVKISGERFTALPSNHPLGHYFDALHLTGYYYTFLGIGQLIIAVLLIIPRTAFLGALMYFPVILNIGVLAYATRFEGTRIITFMMLANLYLLLWDYSRLKILLPFKQPKEITTVKPFSNKVAFAFFGGVILILASVVIINQHLYNIRPGNSLLECTNGCGGNKDCLNFCDCIYNQGKPLDSCLAQYNAATGN